ncbi:MAG: DUF4123 domain-containing protein [Janthinobacterium lividum]
MTGHELAALKRKIWPLEAVRPVKIYAVLDCARNSLIHGLIARSYREKSCLFAGVLDPELERAAPFLLEMQPSDSVTDEILMRGWGDAWGILIRSEGSFQSTRRHLRTLLRVRTEDGRFLLFRYYDPRVLAAYLPTCTPEEVDLVFAGVITEILCCDNNEVMRYAQGEGFLQVTVG